MTVVVGVDGSSSALEAVRWAAREAERRRTDLRLVHVRQPPSVLSAEDVCGRELTEQGHGWLTAARDAATGAAEVDVHLSMRTGQPAWELVTATEAAQLVVVGARGSGGFRGLLLGSVANALAAHGHCPVVVLRGRTTGAPAPDHGPVVVGADGTPASAAAVSFALAAAAARCEVVAVHAWTYEGLVDAWAPVPLTVDWDEIAEAQHRVFDEQLASSRAERPEVAVRSVHYRGRPADGILEQAENARLVVVGAHGRRLAVAGALGSTSYTVLHHAWCPVAVVRDRR